MRTANIATAAGRVVLFLLLTGCSCSCAKGKPAADAPRERQVAPIERESEAPAKRDPQNAVWSLVLEEALPRETGPKPLEVFVQRHGGKWRQALGLAPQWNVSPHKVDPAGLVFEDGKLTGTMAVTLVPDAWVPAEKNELGGTFTVNAALTDATVEGTFEGEVAGTRTSGRLVGVIEPEGRVDVRNCTVDLRLEGALPPGIEEWTRRVWSMVRFVDGRPRECTATFSPLSPDDRTGACDSSDLRLTPDLLGGTLTAEARVDPNRVVYSYKLAGIVVGAHLGGTFTYRLGESDQHGTFTGMITSATRPTSTR
jgi:hypothetical protein